MPWLKFIKGETPGRVFQLGHGDVVLGRDPACEIPLRARGVSKRHARVFGGEEGYRIVDLGSTNGTRVGDRARPGSVAWRTATSSGLGDFQFRFVEGDSEVLNVLDVPTAVDPRFARVHPEQKLLAVLEIARDLGGTIDPGGVLGKVLEALFRIFPQADRGFILIRGVGTDELVLKASKVRDPEDVPPVFSRAVFAHVTGGCQALLCRDIGADSRFGDSPSVKDSGIRTMMCVPLLVRDRSPVGVLQIDTRDERALFEQEDLDLLVAVAGPVGVAIENARLHEAAVEQEGIEQEARDARSVQFALIPKHCPLLPGYEFWHHYQPARFVGGDYFDYRRSSGPGTDRTGFRTVGGLDRRRGGERDARRPADDQALRRGGPWLQAESDPARAVERLNRHLCEPVTRSGSSRSCSPWSTATGTS